MTTNGYEAGLKVRREVLGEDYVDRSLGGAADSPFGPQWQEFLTEYCWGRSWASDVLPRSTLSLVTVALLAALGRGKELGTHIRGARRNGCSTEDIRAVLMHTAVYAGVPAAVEGFRIADEVWTAE